MHNIGIIGYGAFGKFLKQSWEQLANAQVTFITKTKVETVRKMAEEDGIPFYSADYRDLLAAPNVDIVVIATPPHLHESMAIEAFRAGKHVLIEKPLAMNPTQAENIIRAEEESGRVGAVNFMMRYSGLMEKLRALRFEGLLGGLTRVIVDNYASDEGLKPGHWFWDRSKSGGIFIEHGVHFFDLAGWLVDSDPSRIVGFATERETGIQDKVLAAVQYANKTMGAFYHAFSQPDDMEETKSTYIFHRGQIEVFGWIPLELRLKGSVTYAELLRLEEIFPGADAQFSPVEKTEIVSSGVRYTVAHEINLAYVENPDKQEEYAKLVRRLMDDFITAIENPAHQMRVTLADGLRSVQTAYSAAESANAGSE
ncbi:MAG: Gfo/Idh/MocA family oxidoreductase [Armatimonadota bacterium]|nr:Gfo/Idh/MocA family oxidoreductase [Armatimonadota bacterium]